MGKKVKISVGVVTLLIAGSLVAFASVGSQPGSVDDPIVTKSYVDQQIKLIAGQGGGSGQASNEIITVKLNAGDILLAKSGTEFILRSGTAVAYGPAENGIPNLTGGTDIIIGTSIPKNHHLVFPKDDGRGIKITTGPAYVMVRGTYEIQTTQ